VSEGNMNGPPAAVARSPRPWSPSPRHNLPVTAT
jgi:hypothetical protein